MKNEKQDEKTIRKLIKDFQQGPVDPEDEPDLGSILITLALFVSIGIALALFLKSGGAA